jgi:predicted Rossmann fold nucleotide-binding protein DprA/Smf involved in DNA uptake
MTEYPRTEKLLRRIVKNGAKGITRREATAALVELCEPKHYANQPPPVGMHPLLISFVELAEENGGDLPKFRDIAARSGIPLVSVHKRVRDLTLMGYLRRRLPGDNRWQNYFPTKASVEFVRTGVWPTTDQE